jgi:hypothetical protein
VITVQINNDLEIDFDPDLEKPVGARTWAPAFNDWIDCTELFISLYKLGGYWCDETHRSIAVYRQSKLENREFFD